MNSDITLGEKIRKYRLKSGISQFDLETMIETSSGSISRIENNIVSPTKETIKKISNALNLNTSEIADLFNLEFQINKSNLEMYFNSVMETSLEISSSSSLDSLLNIIFDKLLLQLGYVFAGLFLIEGDYLRIKKYSLPKMVNNLLDKLLNTKLLSTYFDLNDTETCKSLLVMTVLNNKIYESEHVYEFSISKYIDAKKSKLLEKLTGIKLVVGIPLWIDGNPIGCLAMTSRNPKASETDQEVLMSFARIISISISKTDYFKS